MFLSRINLHILRLLHTRQFLYYGMLILKAAQIVLQCWISCHFVYNFHVDRETVIHAETTTTEVSYLKKMHKHQTNDVQVGLLMSRDSRLGDYHATHAPSLC